MSTYISYALVINVINIITSKQLVSIEMLMHFCAYLFVIHHPLYVQTNKVESYPFTVYGSLNIENAVVVGTRKHFEVTNVYKLFLSYRKCVVAVGLGNNCETVITILFWSHDNCKRTF